MKKPILIGITGGTGSGKTTVAEAIHSAFEGNSITIIIRTKAILHLKRGSRLTMTIQTQ